jgi:hypothetical protein
MCVYLFISTIIYTIVQFYIYNYIYIRHHSCWFCFSQENLLNFTNGSSAAKKWDVTEKKSGKVTRTQKKRAGDLDSQPVWVF